MGLLPPPTALGLLGAIVVGAGPANPMLTELRPGPERGITSHRPTRSLSGELKTTANDHALMPVVEGWAAAFMKEHRALRVSVEERKGLVLREGLKGSATPPALGVGQLHFGPDGWVLNPEERAEFAKQYGYPPIEIRIGIGTYAEKGKPHAVGVLVNANNPIQRLTLAQVDAIFSQTRRRGYPRDISRWGDLGLGGTWSERPIHTYGKKLRNVITAFFQEQALKAGTFKPTLAEQENSDAVIAAVARDEGGIAFSGVGFMAPGTRLLALAEQDSGPYVLPGQESVASGSYPLSRYLYAAVNKPAGQPLPASVEEFLSFILSGEGQRTLVQMGYLPLPAEMVQQERAKLR